MHCLFACFDSLDYGWLRPVREALVALDVSSDLLLGYLNTENLPQETLRPPLSHAEPSLTLAEVLQQAGFTVEGKNLAGALLALTPEFAQAGKYWRAWETAYPTFVRNVLQQQQPDLVVLDVGEPECDLVLAACNELQIPAVLMLSPFHEFKSAEPFVLPTLDHPVLVAGEHGRDKVLAAGVAADNIVMVCHPRFQFLPQRAPAPKKPIVLFTQQNIPEDEWLLDTLQQYRRKHSDCILRVRPHPTQQKELPPLTSELAAARVLVTASSNTVLDSLLVGRPSLIWETGFLPEQLPYGKRGEAFPCLSKRQLYETLDLLLYGERHYRRWQRKFGNAYQHYLSLNAPPIAETLREWIRYLRPKNVQRENER